MAWSDPVNPVTETVITVAYAVANFLTQIRWLRILTGGADPPGSNYVVRSTSTTATAWSKIIEDMITPGAVRGDAAGSAIGEGAIHPNRLVPNAFDAAQVAGAFNTNAIDATNAADIIAANAINGDAKLVAGSVTGNAGGSAIGTGAIHPNRLVPNAFDATQVAAAFGTNSFDATNVADIIADGAITPGKGGVPLGAVVWFETLAELTAAGANWARYTAADGRLLVGAGASASGQTFIQAQNYGADWTPAIGVSVNDTIGVGNGTLAATAGTLAGTAAASALTTIVAGAAGITVSVGPHTHAVTVTGAPALSGSVAKSGSAAIAGAGTVWLPYMRAGVWGKRV